AIGLQALVQQPDTEPHVNAHLLLIDLTSNSVLDQDVGRVGAKLVTSIRDLGNNFGVPLPLRLASRDESTHHQFVHLSPVLTGASGNVSDDVCILPLIETRLVADGAFSYFNDVFLATVFDQLVLGGEVAFFTWGN